MAIVLKCYADWNSDIFTKYAFEMGLNKPINSFSRRCKQIPNNYTWLSLAIIMVHMTYVCTLFYFWPRLCILWYVMKQTNTKDYNSYKKYLVVSIT